MSQIMKHQPALPKRPHVPRPAPSPHPQARRAVEIRVAAEVRGGLGDLLLASIFFQALHAASPEVGVDIYYHVPESASFVFQQARFVRGIHHSDRFALARKSSDLVFRLDTVVRTEIRSAEKLRIHAPELLDALMRGVGRAEGFRGVIDAAPQLDGLLGRLAVQSGFNRRTAAGWFTGLDCSGEPQLFLSPNPAQYEWFQQQFPDPSFNYLTLHDGFDNNVRLAPGNATKCWPLRHWTELVRQLKAAMPGVKVVQIGSRHSRPIPGVDLDLVQQTSLDQVSWILKHARLHIDGDSGLVHMARALHTPCVVIFGPTDFQFFGYPKNKNLFFPGCGNCWWSTPAWLSRCPRGLAEPECMAGVPPDQVCAAAVEISARRPAAEFELVTSAVYGIPSYAELNPVLRDIFAAAQLPAVPISQHAQSSESTLYLHASKQWEYVFAWSCLSNRFPSGVSGMKVADLGGGRGAWPAFLARAGADVNVFDLNYLWDHGGDEQIEGRFLTWARGHGYAPRFGSMFNVPAEDASYDIVSSISVIEHLRPNRYALKEALRILKPGGLLILTFDFSLEPQKHQDSLRQDIFSPQTLDQTLRALGIGSAAIPPATVTESVAAIQRDLVLGIPAGMTVGGIAITKRSPRALHGTPVSVAQGLG